MLYIFKPFYSYYFINLISLLWRCHFFHEMKGAETKIQAQQESGQPFLVNRQII